MKKDELLEAMRSIMQGVEKASSSEGMDYVLMDKDWLRSFNDFLSVSYPIPIGLQCAVKAAEFYRILTKLEGDEVEITDGDGVIVIKSGRSTVRLVKLADEKFEAFKRKIFSLNTEGLTWTQVPEEFNEGAHFCMLSAGKEGRLEGVAFSGNHILSSDNLRASMYVSGVDLGTFALTTRVLSDLLRISMKWKFICKEEAWIHLKEDKNLIVSGKTSPGENFPADQIIKLFTVTEKLTTYAFPEGMIKAVERAEVLAGSGELEGLAHLVLKYDKGDLLIIGERDQVGVIEERVAWPEKSLPADVELKLSPGFLLKILGLSREFTANPKSVLFSAGNFSHLMVGHKIQK